MTIEEIRRNYVSARELTRTGDNSNSLLVIEKIQAISDYVKELYERGTVMEKAKCRARYESFDAVIEIIKTCGLGDARVSAFFGLAPSSASAPSFSDIMSGKGSLTPQKEDSNAVKPKSNVGAETAVPKVKSNPNPLQTGTVRPSVGTTNGGGEDKPVFDPDSLDGFIGQQHIVQPLKKEIKIAKNKGENFLGNILLFGNPGLGKSTLMKLVAKELGAEYEQFDCSQIRNSQQALKQLQNFLLRVAKANKPVVIAFDELHMLSHELQSALLTLLNDRVFVSPPDINGNIKRIPIENFTFIGATTNDEGVLSTIKNRCLRLTFQLVDYSHEELKRIYKNKIASKGLTITDEAVDACIPRSRGAIRYVNSIVDGLDRALYNDDGMRTSLDIDLNVALAYFEEKGIDPMGLTDKDLEILHALEGSDGMGVEVLAARVGLEAKKYQSEYEKYLIKIGFIDVMGKGRVLTPRAIQYLGGVDGDSDAYPHEQTAEEPSHSEAPVSPDVVETEVNPFGNDDNNGDGAADAPADEPKDIIDELFGD